jgi:hypothetical protein
VKQLGPDELSRWLLVLAEMDLALKGGSKRPPRAILEASLVALCGKPPRGQASDASGRGRP